MSGAQVSTDFVDDNPSFGVTGVMFRHPARSDLLPLPEPADVSMLRLASIALGMVTIGQRID